MCSTPPFPHGKTSSSTSQPNASLDIRRRYISETPGLTPGGRRASLTPSKPAIRTRYSLSADGTPVQSQSQSQLHMDLSQSQESNVEGSSKLNLPSSSSLLSIAPTTLFSQDLSLPPSQTLVLNLESSQDEGQGERQGESQEELEYETEGREKVNKMDPRSTAYSTHTSSLCIPARRRSVRWASDEELVQSRSIKSRTSSKERELGLARAKAVAELVSLREQQRERQRERSHDHEHELKTSKDSSKDLSCAFQPSSSTASKLLPIPAMSVLRLNSDSLTALGQGSNRTQQKKDSHGFHIKSSVYTPLRSSLIPAVSLVSTPVAPPSVKRLGVTETSPPTDRVRHWNPMSS